MSKTMDKKLTIVLRKEGKWYAATIREVPEVHTQGRTEKEALDNAIDALHDIEKAKDGLLSFHKMKSVG